MPGNCADAGDLSLSLFFVPDVAGMVSGGLLSSLQPKGKQPGQQKQQGFGDILGGLLDRKK
ncbi:MAG: hypothetical protein LAP21_03250 [Acidobacteriia bacterium]|nr:hypothetical protein [Terriglobia bacterium]